MSKSVEQGLLGLLSALTMHQKRPKALSVRRQRQILQQANKLSKDPMVQHHFNALMRALNVTYKKPGLGVSSPQPVTEKVLHLDGNTPNIMAGQPVAQEIIVHGDVSGVVFHAFMLSDENLFDHFDVDYEALVIKAKAIKAENVTVTLIGLKPHPSGTAQTVKLKIKLAIIPDPKTLWKNLPSDESARFHKPDADAKLLENSQFSIAAGSLRGRAHAHKGTHRDDDFEIIGQEASWQVLSVADGAGSCKWSRRGAQLAVQKSAATLADALNGRMGEPLLAAYEACLADESAEHIKKLQESYRETIVKAVHEAVLAIQQEVGKHKGDTLKDYSTTLMLAAIKPVADGYVVLAFWIGDGAVALMHDDQLSLLGDADAGQYAGQTRFLTPKVIESGDVYQRVRIKKVKTLKGLILASDGVTDPYFETDAELKSLQAWERLFAEIAPFSALDNSETAKIIDWLGFWSPGNHDDRTFALLVPKEQA